MHFHKNISFYTNKKVYDYLKLYEKNRIQDILRFHKNTPAFTDALMPPRDPLRHLLFFSATHILAFLAGYYSHYF